MTNETELTTSIRHDLFAAIKYETRSAKKGAVTGLQLGPHFVFKWIVQDAWKHISTTVATAVIAKVYTAESLFNDATSWAEYDHGHRVAIGRALLYFLDRNMLPLHCLNRHASGTKQYVLLA